MDEMVSSNINDLAPSDSVGARRFLDQLAEAVNALQKPNIAEQLTGKLAAKGGTVPELLQDMSSKGLTFAPATSGDESAYVALHNYLVGFNAALSGAQ